MLNHFPLHSTHFLSSFAFFPPPSVIYPVGSGTSIAARGLDKFSTCLLFVVSMETQREERKSDGKTYKREQKTDVRVEFKTVRLSSLPEQRGDSRGRRLLARMRLFSDSLDANYFINCKGITHLFSPLLLSTICKQYYCAVNQDFTKNQDPFRNIRMCATFTFAHRILKKKNKPHHKGEYFSRPLASLLNFPSRD